MGCRVCYSLPTPRYALLLQRLRRVTMPDDIVISVENITKAYRIWNDPGARLMSPLLSTCGSVFPHSARLRHKCEAKAASYYRDFYALRDISFQVHKGESVGIIGRNGSGKSTLLQIIAGTLQPSSGSVRVKGRVAALLELGSGFNPDFTGRENVYLNAAVLGLSRAETYAKFETIAAFADIGDFIDQPVKTYSSGMMMRLAFSVQISINPDILIVDEALAVGDAAFVGKCINRVGEFIRHGGTLLFVSHDVGLLKQITQKCLYLENGLQKCFDQTIAVASAYEASFAPVAATLGVAGETFTAPTAPYRIESIQLMTGTGPATETTIHARAPLSIKVELGRGHYQPCYLVFSIYNYLSLIVVSQTLDLPPISDPSQRLELRIDLPGVRLAPGNYRMNFAVRVGSDILSWWKNAVRFTVQQDGTETFIYREDVLIELKPH